MISTLVIGLAALAAAPDGSTDADRSAYEAAASAAGRDPEAQVKLALWCEAHGMPAERLKHLTRAVLLDPDNVKARGLLGQVQRDGKWMRADDVAKSVEDSPVQRRALAEYMERRVKAKDRADDQYRLALWCEEHGLPQPMIAHLQRTLQLDPGREGALRRLGFKKFNGRWVNPAIETALKEAREAQTQADKEWKAKLERIRVGLVSRAPAQRAEAAEALEEISDPRAVPSVWRVFADSEEERSQRIALGLLSRIDGPGASTALARLAVFSPHAVIRSDAARWLMRRDARDYSKFLIGLIRKEIRYKIKNVEGPGSQGELLVQGEQANVRRLYTPLAPIVRLGEAVDPSVTWSFSSGGVSLAGADPSAPYFTLGELAAAREAARASSPLSAIAAAAPQLAGLLPGARQATPAMDASAKNRIAVSGAGGRDFQEVGLFQNTTTIPFGMMVAETRFSALVAQQQLLDDVGRIETANAPIREVNERAQAILRTVSGRDFGDDVSKWTTWAVDLDGYAYVAPPPPEVPTYVEPVPLAYTPQYGPVMARQQVGSAIVGRPTAPHGYCFAAGTIVRALQGPRPIETIQAGDQVLAQDTTTGEYRYQAVASVFHNPPNETLRIVLESDDVVATGIHRFWKAGHGWVMARDLRPGDRLRTVGGTAVVKALEKDRVQPVFNLALVGGDAFCVGSQGVVAHDNSFVAPVLSPFDAVAELASTGKP